jgi:glutathione synthase/RimK-type ligase-like ATP-grasp enzyme
MCPVVAITASDDAHLSFVQAHLNDDIIVIDPQGVQRNEELSYFATAHGAHVIFKGEALDRVTGVWYRKPGELSIEALAVPDHFREYALGAQRNHFSMLRRAFQSAAWVSDYFAIERMRNKFRQLQLARECGFLVPDTLITSSQESRVARGNLTPGLPQNPGVTVSRHRALLVLTTSSL